MKEKWGNVFEKEQGEYMEGSDGGERIRKLVHFFEFLKSF